VHTSNASSELKKDADALVKNRRLERVYSGPLVLFSPYVGCIGVALGALFMVSHGTRSRGTTSLREGVALGAPSLVSRRAHSHGTIIANSPWYHVFPPPCARGLK
jgi:hypothetical protein